MAQSQSGSLTPSTVTLVTPDTLSAIDDHDLWGQALHKALAELPAKDSEWLSGRQNRTPFTTTQLVEAIRPFQEKHSNHAVQKFFAKIDPIISHVRSFARVVCVFANADPTGAGIVWGSIYLVLIVAGRTQRSLERILDFLSELSPQFALFSRWQALFPQKSFVEVGDAIKSTYSEIMGFCVTAVRFLRRNPLVSLARTMMMPGIEQTLEKHDTRIRRCTSRVREEVDTAHMQFVQTQLAAIGSIIDPAPNPRYLEFNRQAQKYALEAVSKGHIAKNDQRMPRILTGLGNSLSQLKEFDDALSVHLEAKRLCGDVPPEQSDAITIIQLNWGFLMYRRGDLESAEKILRAALEASPRTPPALYALGNTVLAQGKIEEAIAVHLQGLELYIALFGDQHALVGRTAYKVGEILLLHKSAPKTARTYIRKAVRIYLKQESTYYIVKAYARGIRMMAKVFEMQGRQDEADRYFNEAWALKERVDGVRGSKRDEDEVYTSVMFYWDQ